MDNRPLTSANYPPDFTTDTTPPLAPRSAPMRMPSGRTVDALHLDPMTVHVADIARTLSQICRWNGQVRHFYSVAQHSLMLAWYLWDDLHAGPEAALWGLLHDAGEAYAGGDARADLRWFAPRLVALQEECLRSVARAFSLPWPMPAVVDEVDHRIRADEWDALKVGPRSPDVERLEPLGVRIRMMMPDTAERLFLKEFRRLTDALARMPAGVR